MLTGQRLFQRRELEPGEVLAGASAGPTLLNPRGFL